jgi:23S rRNA (adenine2503-C2)-methyltransferase
VKKVVFMGMGEPAHNLEAVVPAIEALGTLGGIGHKNLVFSTVGDPRVFERLPTLSRASRHLHCRCIPPEAELRAELLPRAPRIDPAGSGHAGRGAMHAPPAIRSSTSGR